MYLSNTVIHLVLKSLLLEQYYVRHKTKYEYKATIFLSSI